MAFLSRLQAHPTLLNVPIQSSSGIDQTALLTVASGVATVLFVVFLPDKHTVILALLAEITHVHSLESLLVRLASAPREHVRFAYVGCALKMGDWNTVCQISVLIT